MTYRELMDEVIHLGFDSAVEDLGALCSATNRAVAQLRRELCPATGRFVLNVREPVFYQFCEEDASGKSISFEVEDAAAMSFESIGGATVRFEEDGVVLKEERIASPTWRERKILYPRRGARCVIVGEGGFALRKIAVFDIVDNKENPDALPMIDRVARFDVTAYCKDFLALEDTPYNEMGFPVREYEIYGMQLSLPTDSGRVEVTYRRELRRAALEDFSDGSNATPDIPTEYADLLPLCVASYVWVDLEPEKAAHYKQMYNEQLQYAKLQQKHRGKRRVVDRKGWR